MQVLVFTLAVYWQESGNVISVTVQQLQFNILLFNLIPTEEFAVINDPICGPLFTSSK